MILDKLHSSLPFYNKNTSSSTVYDQGANRLRKFILLELGASLFLIELLFTENTSACMYMIRLEQCRIIYFKRFILRRYTALDHLICFDFASKLSFCLEEVSSLNFVVDITL